jgi:hypothetical protein
MYTLYMTRTIRKRNSEHPTRDGNHNPVCINPDTCKDCGDNEWSVLNAIKNAKILVIILVVETLREA